MTRKLTLIILLNLLLVCAAFAQTTAFSYQGSLNNTGTPATGNHDFEFALFDALAAGTQLGSTLTRSTVAVANGTFAVSLDFGSQFPGANRFLEIRVRPSGGGAFTPLTPRQLVNSAPYSVKSLSADTATTATSATTATNATNATNATTAATATNALSLGGVAAGQYVLTGDARLVDARTPTAGSANYIQNQNTGPQATSNFNISGNGTAGGTLSGNIVNTVTQYNIGGSRILSNPGTNNLFAGIAAGQSNTTGFSNAFFGRDAGLFNTTGTSNSFFGRAAGQTNTTGNDNSFFGTAAGQANTTGGDNAFFGDSAGQTNTTGSSNTFIGAFSNVSAGNLTNATAIGNGATVNASNKVRIGNSLVTVIEGQVAYTFSSDKNLKENFLAVNGRDVLRKIRGFNMTSWNYIGQDAKAFRHYGPMAQEFYAAFGRDKFGSFGSPTTINTGDMSGVMLSAIKELSTENETQKAQIEAQQKQIEAQQKLIEALEKRLVDLEKKQRP